VTDTTEKRGDTRVRRIQVSAPLDSVTEDDVRVFFARKGDATAKALPFRIVDAAQGVIEVRFDGQDATGTYRMEVQVDFPAPTLGEGKMRATFPSDGTVEWKIVSDLAD
jgi:hypothetical protein